MDHLRRLPSVAALARPLGVGVALAGLGYSAGQTHQDLFGRWAGHADLSLAYRADIMRIETHLKSLPADTEAFFSPYSWIEPALEFARAGDTSRLHPYDGHYCLPLGDNSRHPLAYFVSDPYSLSALRHYYPNGRETAAPELAIFEITAGDPLNFASGLPRSVGRAVWAEQLALPHVEAQAVDAQTVRVNLIWQTRLPTTGVSYHRFVHLLNDDPAQPGGVRLWAQDDNLLCHGTHPPHYWQPGEFIADSVTLTAAEPLPPGDYRVAVGLYAPGAPVRLAVAETTWPVKDDVVTIAVLFLR
jgi:hypothetical protein